jgi:CubicO group peptidase (beta-lactamase class C family)
MTVAFLVLHQGKIVAEKYADGVTATMPLESWSMGKSIAATLIGRLIYLGQLSLDEPAPIPEWQGEDKDAITVRNLLNMSSGIEFERALSWYKPVRDHFHVYSGGMDTVSFINDKPLQHPPGTVGRYRNSDPLSLMNILRRIVEEAGEDYLSWPQLQLFDNIGARHFVLEPDPHGIFLISGYDYGVARDWARLGLLYLQDGVWMGERLLPEGFTRFVSTEAPAWTGEVPSYGGLFWINRGPHFEALPEQSYFMAGAGSQHVWIIPDHDLVMVRMGHRRGDIQKSLHGTLNKTHALVLEAIRSPDIGGR